MCYVAFVVAACFYRVRWSIDLRISLPHHEESHGSELWFITRASDQHNMLLSTELLASKYLLFSLEP